MRRAFAAALVFMLVPALASAQPEPPEAYPAPPPEAYPAPPVQPPPPSPGHQGYQPPPGMMPAPPVARRPSTRVSQNVAIYGDLLGKGLLYGVGMDFNFNKWIGLGATVSYYSIGDLRAGVAAPYLALYAGGFKNAFLTQLGPVVMFGKEGSWWIFDEGGTMGLGQVSLGYEYRDGFLFRAMMTFFFNDKEIAPWPGLTFGGAF